MCSGQLLTTANGTLPLIVAGAPSITVGLTSLGRVVFVIGLALVLAGSASLLLAARSHRQLTRSFDECRP